MAPIDVPAARTLANLPLGTCLSSLRCEQSLVGIADGMSIVRAWACRYSK